MLPIELTIEGLRSYCERVNLDFRGRNEIAIVGDTGSGKSSIIEAITYALYGQTTFPVLNRELINDNARQLRVSLHFRVGTDEWKVVRTLRRSENGKVGGSSAELQRLGENGKKLESVDNVRPVNERLEALVGMSREAFLRTRVLPQGRFSQLLVEDDPRVRSAILRQVWRTDDVEAAGKIITDTHQKIIDLRVRIAKITMSYPEDPRLYEKELLDLSKKTDKASRDADKKEGRVVAAVNDLSDAKDVIVRARVVLLELGAFDGTALSSALEPLIRANEIFKDRVEILQHRQLKAASALSAIPNDEDGLSLAQITKALATLETIGPRAHDALTAATKHQEQCDSANQKSIAAKEAVKIFAIKSQEIKSRLGRSQALEQEKKEAKRWLEKIRKQYRRVLQSHENLKDAKIKLSGEKIASQQIEQFLNLLLTQQLEHYFASLGSSHGISTSSIQSLKPGDPCPICERILLPGWESSDSRLEQTVSQLVAAKNMKEKLSEVKTKLSEQRDSLKESMGSVHRRFQKASESFTDDRVLFQKLIEGSQLLRNSRKPEEITKGSLRARPLKHLTGLLESIERRFATVLDEVNTCSKVLYREQEEVSKLEITCKIMSEAAAESKQHQINSEQNAREMLDRLHETLASIPEFYRPLLTIPIEPSTLTKLDLAAVNQQISAASERTEKLEQRAQERNQLVQFLQQIAVDLQTLREAQELQVGAKTNHIVRELNRHRDILSRSVTALDLGLDLPDIVTASCNKELLAVIAQFKGINNDLLKYARDQEERATDKVLSANAELGGFRTVFNVKEVVDVPKHAKEFAENARYAARIAQESTKKFTAIAGQLISLRELYDDITERERVFSDLEAALKDGAFLKWLTLRRSRSLLIHASSILEKMSRGRYTFMEPENELDRWQILDQESGRSRSPASLSGGEQFAASLALALGMVEIIERSGSRIESLFIDEGFGSLDLQNLDSALKALRLTVDSGRMVVLVSHVQAVAEKIANVATVVRSQNGSQIEWLSTDLQEKISKLDSHSSALKGLL